MPYIGKEPVAGNFVLLDSITTSATATYALTKDSVAYSPESARNMIVSLNGVTQAPETAFTVSGSNITFSSALTSSDVIDYILVLGDVLSVGTPSDGTVGTSQMSYPLGNFSSTGIDDNATSTAITIDASENVGIGTTSPTAYASADTTLEVKGKTGTGLGAIQLSGADGGVRTLMYAGGSTEFNINTQSNHAMSFYTNNSKRMTIDASGNVGIGTTSPLNKLVVSEGTGQHGIELAPGTTSYIQAYDRAIADYGDLKIDAQIIQFGTDNGTERMRIDSSGNVGIGTTSPQSSQKLHIANTAGNCEMALQSSDSGVASLLFGDATDFSRGKVTYDNSSDSMAFQVNNLQEAMRIDSSGDLLVGGTTSSTSRIKITGDGGTYTNYSMLLEAGSEDNAYHGISLMTPGNALGGIIGSNYELNVTTVSQSNTGRSSGYIAFSNTTVAGKTSNIEFGGVLKGTAVNVPRMTLDNDGNLLVGKTVADDSTVGTRFNNAGFMSLVRDSGRPLFIRRDTTDGDMLEFSKGGTTIGSIGNTQAGIEIQNGAGYGILIISADTGVPRVLPRLNYAVADNVMDLGDSGSRYDDIYATNGTIQTSDINEKQDIEVLSDAEQRVAVAAKALLRKFRWKSAVEEKGDEARIHFGIIAQDLKAAFEAEGLDAGRYGMFMSDTWTDEETGEERTRLGVRYHELLAFIIAAI